MERNLKINPVGLKGREINERMKQLMGVSTINENLSRSTVELTKMGPDGKVYGIVRENHEYYIKVADKTSNLTVEDFKYIGGLQNKKSEVYPSYARATKHLNLKFNSICESYDIVNTFNVFVDDNLLAEHHPYKADQTLSATKGMGDAQEYVVNKAGKVLSTDAKVGKESGQFGDNVAKKDVDDEFEEVKLNENEISFGDDIELSEDEMAIDAMLDDNYSALSEYGSQYMEEPSDVAAEGLSVITDLAKKAGISLDKFIDMMGKKLHGGGGLGTGTTMYEENDQEMTFEQIDEVISDLKKKL
jgi:hypothetical protein